MIRWGGVPSPGLPTSTAGSSGPAGCARPVTLNTCSTAKASAMQQEGGRKLATPSLQSWCPASKLEAAMRRDTGSQPPAAPVVSAKQAAAKVRQIHHSVAMSIVERLLIRYMLRMKEARLDVTWPSG